MHIYDAHTNSSVVLCVQNVHRNSFAATTVSALRGPSAATPDRTVLMALMSVNVVSRMKIFMCGLTDQ